MGEPAADVLATLAVLQSEHSALFRKLVQNVSNAPSEPKYRRLNLANAKIGALCAVPEARRGFEALGWRPTSDGELLELPQTASLSILEHVLKATSPGELWAITILVGPLRKRLELPLAARLGHLALAIERSHDLGQVPRSRQLLLAGYPPRPLSEGDTPLKALGIKTVMLEDRWEQFVADMRSCRATFVQVAAVLDCPVLRTLALDDNITFVRDRIIAMLKSRVANVPLEEMQAAQRCREVTLPAHNSATHSERIALCTAAAGSVSKRPRADQPREPGDGLFGDEMQIDDEPEVRFVLVVERSNLLHSTISQIAEASLEELRGPLEIRFVGEAAEDAGGLRREFFNEFGRACASAAGAWRLTPAGSLVPTPAGVAALHVPDAARRREAYRSCGRVFGMSFCQGAKPPHQPLLLGLPLARSFLHVLQGHIVDTVEELQAELNAEQHSSTPDFRGSAAFRELSLKELGLEGQLTFSYTLPGDAGVVDLVPGGRDLIVTDQDKEQWLRATLKYELTDSLQEAAEGFRAGVCEVVSATHLVLLDAGELQEAWSGRSVVTDEDLQTWRERTVVSPAVSQQAEWLFELLRGDLREARPRILKFATGSDRWPVDARGFKFVIEPMDGGDTALPCAMTCGNMLQLPRYTGREPLRERLLQAVEWGSDLHLK